MYSPESKKLALTRIKEIFETYSDFEHPLTQNDIAEHLDHDYGINIDRKTIGRNISLLKETGIEIESDHRGSYLGSRLFEDSELRMLIDGILCSKYITAKHSEDLIKRICGLSNISFGMPERGYVNTAFLTLAIQAGLTMAIANPSQELLVACSLATDLLLGKDEADIAYIDYASQIKEKQEEIVVKLPKQLQNKSSVPGPVTDSKTEKSHRDTIYKAVLKGNRHEIATMTREALTNGEDAQSILNEVLLPAINEVGVLFDKGKYFLPQLIGSAEAMKNSIEVLEPYLLKKSDNENKPVIVIATVEGDIHDIGKNLVALMLKNYGFRVIDLGKDVPKEEIIEAAQKYDAKIIALSALMTTTMQKMKEVIQFAEEVGCTSKIMIGGAVITQEYADEIFAKLEEVLTTNLEIIQNNRRELR